MSESTAETPAKSVNAFTAFENYDNFKGKASPAEFWAFYLLVHVVVLTLMIPAMPIFFRETGEGVVTENNWHATLTLSLPVIIWGLLVVIPLVSLLVRRLNDSLKKFLVYYGIGAVAIIALGICGWLFLKETSPYTFLFWVLELVFIGAGVLPRKPAEESK